MNKVILGITISLDGYINDRNGSLQPLFSDIFVDQPGDTVKDDSILSEAITATGAVIMGKNAYLMAEDVDSYADNYEFQVPIFILTHHLPTRHPKENDKLKFTFVAEGLEKAVEMARKVAAEGKDIVIIGGAQTARQAIKQNIPDEIQIDVMPVLLGGGTRLFEDPLGDPMRLEKIQVHEYRERVSLRYRLLK